MWRNNQIISEKRELDMEALQKEILRKCRKRTELPVLPDETEDDEHKEEDLYEEDVSTETTDEELPFEDVLAEKRRKYTAREELIYSLYNNILPAFITEWNGYFLRRERFAGRSSQEDAETLKESEEKSDNKKNNSFNEEEEKEEEKDKIEFVSPWKLSLPDEFADIKFYNNNSYCGRISRKMMEGDGTYTWHNGVQYKGQFEHNKIQGRGILKWNDNCWYEGDFVDGLRHGKGVLVDKKNNRIYAGQWCMGRMDGKGC